MKRTLPYRKHKRDAGFTLIELMIAVAVLVVGLLAVLALFTTAIGNNGRSKVDTTSTMISQAVLEQISAVLAGGGPGSVNDCTGQQWTIETDQGGAALSGSGIDFSETAPPANYSMMYVVCSDAASDRRATYDVRWHITQIDTSAEPTFLVTVAARPKNMRPGRFTFALPVTLRRYVGSQ